MKNYSDKLFADGYVHVPNFFSSEEIKDIDNAIESVHSNPTLFKISKKSMEPKVSDW